MKLMADFSLETVQVKGRWSVTVKGLKETCQSTTL